MTDREERRKQLHELIDHIFDNAIEASIDRELGHEYRIDSAKGMNYLRRTGEHTVTIRWKEDDGDPYAEGDLDTMIGRLT